MSIVLMLILSLLYFQLYAYAWLVSPENIFMMTRSLPLQTKWLMHHPHTTNFFRDIFSLKKTFGSERVRYDFDAGSVSVACGWIL
jgi:hypothetical protein